MGPPPRKSLSGTQETIGENGRVLMPDPLFKEFEYGVYSKITLSGNGVETWTPVFSFICARYLHIEGASLDPNQGLPVVPSLVGRHASSAARRLGNVKTGKEDVNALISLCYWSITLQLPHRLPAGRKFGWFEMTHLLLPDTQYHAVHP